MYLFPPAQEDRNIVHIASDCFISHAQAVSGGEWAGLYVGLKIQQNLFSVGHVIISPFWIEFAIRTA
jgi:hypothetical protein